MDRRRHVRGRGLGGFVLGRAADRGRAGSCSRSRSILPAAGSFWLSHADGIRLGPRRADRRRVRSRRRLGRRARGHRGPLRREQEIARRRDPADRRSGRRHRRGARGLRPDSGGRRRMAHRARVVLDHRGDRAARSLGDGPGWFRTVGPAGFIRTAGFSRPRFIRPAPLPSPPPPTASSASSFSR